MIALLASAAEPALSAAAGASRWAQPVIDWHALAPEIVLLGVVSIVMILDMGLLERAKPIIGSVTGLGFLVALIPLITLALSDDTSRSLFGGTYVVDRPALVLKALFLVTGYVVTLMSTNYVAEGDYWESEYYSLMVMAILGMTVMASARDLISIFVAFELLSIPTYMLAAWRKRDVRSNEAGLKYFLMGVFATGVLLYGMSLLYGVTGTTSLPEIATRLDTIPNTPALTLAVVLIVVGFGFKVSAVPFHSWAPDTYEGAPTPVTAFLAVASKAAGFVALINVVFFAFIGVERGGKSEVIRALLAVLAALSMTVGNLIALRQTNIVRLLAYSGIAQAGFILAPFAVASTDRAGALSSIIVYLVIYAAMNLGAFAVVIAVARRTGSAEMDTWSGLFSYSPGLAVAMGIFLMSLVGMPPLAGWYAKFGVFSTVMGSGSGWGYVLGVLIAVNTAIAAGYYLKVAKPIFFDDAPEGETTPIHVPFSLASAIGITIVATLLFGVLPGLLTDASTQPERPAPIAAPRR